MPEARSRPSPIFPEFSRTPTASAFRLLATLILLLVILHPASSQEDPNSTTNGSFFYGIVDVRRYFFWGWNLLPTGIDVTFGYRLPPWFEGVDTILQATVGGGYEGFSTFRTWNYIPNTPVSPADATADPNGNLEFNSPNVQWQAGIRQGILWNPRERRNLLEGFLYYRGRYDRYHKGRHYWGSSDSQIAAIEASHETWQSSYLGTDAYGIFGNSLFTGLAFDALHFDRRSKAYDGTYAEASFEISPYFPSVLGASDFWRVNFSTKTFRTLYEVRPETEKNVFTIYAGSYFSIDYADASRQMPLYVMQTFGGTEPREGLAEAVRGFEDYSWDTQLKIVHNLDLRFNLPVIHSFGDRDLLPGLVLYFDLGYGSRYWGDPADTPGGFLGSTGIGLFVDLLDFVYTYFYAHLPLIGERIDGAPFVLDLDIGLTF
ncbi:MAG: hypothetical protein JSV89_18375 [Spirochaetaceae bacterium]|nr:MAG: hypothetical protein JSV89_18375 [Spirochaetaceae bacterium]